MLRDLQHPAAPHLRRRSHRRTRHQRCNSADLCAGLYPWNNGTTYLNKPSTILLPATGGATPTPIIISTPWILPSNTHLIGEGDGIPSSGFTPGTTIQAGTSFSGSMIQFGTGPPPSSPPICPPVGSVYTCTGISVENLTLDGKGQSVNGISNAYSQDGSYVNHVSLYQIRGVGLVIQGSAQGNASNSGPYSNITFDLGGNLGTSQTACASINGLSGTHGIHGLTCISGDNVSPAAVLLDSSNNSIEDVRIVGFYDGIRIGANGNAQSNVLFNIIGDTTASGVTPIIVVHIADVGHTVTDLSVMGANNAGGSSGTITIKDDLTGAQLTDTSVGIYALGNTGTGNYYSRFTTSSSVASWVVGPSAPSGSCAEGSLYSCIGNSSLNGSGCTNGTADFALWACAYNSSASLLWRSVI